jgi:hypothetical protein
MRKLVLALTITLALSLALGGGLALAAKAVTPGVSALAKYGMLVQLDDNTNINENANGNTNDDANDNANDNSNDNANDNSNVNTNDNTNEAVNDGAYCRGDKTKKHPDGEKLAGEFFGTEDPAAFEAGYTEIMGWFCGGNGGVARFGFGEIKLGYQIAAAAGLTPAEIFAMRAEGEGWGNILKDLGLKMKDVKPPKPPKPENGNNGQGNAYGQDKEKSNNGQGNANGHDKDKGNKGKKP